MSRYPALSTLAVAGILACSTQQLPADVVRLQNGGKLRGTLEAAVKGQPYRLRTLNGTVVIVDPEQIQSVERRPLIVEQYELRAELTPDTVDAQWELAEWCREHRLNEQRRAHLERVVQIDTDHAAARAALDHVRRNGQWTSREEMMRLRGYVKYKGKYVTELEMEILEKNREVRAAEQQWFDEVRLWRGWLRQSDLSRRAQGANKLRTVNDPHAIAALRNFLAEDPDPNVRALYVEVLTQIRDPKAVEPLVWQTLNDPENRVRASALNGLNEDRVAAALGYLVRGLQSPHNAVVRHAGHALGQIGDSSVIPALIDALVTSHAHQIEVVDNSNTMSFNVNGGFGTPNPVLPPEVELGLRTGQYPDGVLVLPSNVPQIKKSVKVTRAHQNAEVRTALRNLTGVDYNYDEREWSLWWATQKKAAAAGALQP